MPENKEKTKSVFASLKSIDVSKDIDKKETNGRKLSYLSWATAYERMMTFDPNATWRVAEFGEDGIEVDADSKGLPYQKLGNLGYFVKTYVTIGGETKSMFLPIMDMRNNAVKDHPYVVELKSYKYPVNPLDSMILNKAILRCFVKTLALFGLGINLYQGEDLPTDDDLVTKDGELVPNILGNLPGVKAKETPKEENAPIPAKTPATKTKAGVTPAPVEAPPATTTEAKATPTPESSPEEEIVVPIGTDEDDFIPLEELKGMKFENPAARISGRGFVEIVEACNSKANKAAVLKIIKRFANGSGVGNDMKACQSLLHYLETGEVKFADSCN